VRPWRRLDEVVLLAAAVLWSRCPAERAERLEEWQAELGAMERTERFEAAVTIVFSGLRVSATRALCTAPDAAGLRRSIGEWAERANTNMTWPGIAALGVIGIVWLTVQLSWLHAPLAAQVVIGGALGWVNAAVNIRWNRRRGRSPAGSLPASP
jgi:hypothetical protein